MRSFGGFAPATPGFIALLPPLAVLGRRAAPASSGLGPGIGARVGFLRSYPPSGLDRSTPLPAPLQQKYVAEDSQCRLKKDLF